MTIIDTATLKEGMLFSSPLLFDDEKNMFLAERLPVTKMHLDAIRKWGFKTVITYGKPIDSADDGVDDLESLDELEDEDNPALSTYITLQKEIETLFKSFLNGSGIEKKLIDDCVNMVHSLLDEDKRSLAGLNFTQHQNNLMPITINAVNIAIFSALVAQGMSFPQKDTINLITASFVHDIEMLKQPSDVVNKKGALTEAEFATIKTHCKNAVNTIVETLSLPKEVALIALQHHEQWDGKGYPEGKSDQQIYISARVLAVVDAFEAMVSDRPHRPGILPHEAVKVLLAGKDKKYDPTVLKAFVSTIGVYPIGSFVLLNDGSTAKVVEANAAAPFFPTVQICMSKTTSITVDSIINLQEKGMSVSKAISETDLNNFS